MHFCSPHFVWCWTGIQMRLPQILGMSRARACPWGYVPIGSEVECREAVALLGKTEFKTVTTQATYGGCSFRMNQPQKLYWNYHPTGFKRTKRNHVLVCAPAPTDTTCKPAESHGLGYTIYHMGPHAGNSNHGKTGSWHGAMNTNLNLDECLNLCRKTEHCKGVDYMNPEECAKAEFCHGKGSCALRNCDVTTDKECNIRVPPADWTLFTVWNAPSCQYFPDSMSGCPAGSEAVMDEAECEAVAKEHLFPRVLKKADGSANYMAFDSNTTYQPGCNWGSQGRETQFPIYFNRHPTGGRSSHYRLVCKRISWPIP